MSSVELSSLLAELPRSGDPHLLVGYETSDDAGVYRLRDDLAIVVTADFITPPVDDPVVYGEVAAANALSDVYAMGGQPTVCLNLVGFPSGKLGPEVLAGIVEGARRKVEEAGAVLAGGHTVEDEEPKFGLAVTGIVHPERIWRNVGARAGDVLLLTKPLGSGVLLNANLKGRVSAPAIEACLDTLRTLNATAARVLSDYPVHAVTDVTGFGLAGHALEMARGTPVTLEIPLAGLPVLDEALAMYEGGVTTGVNASNRAQTEAEVRFDAPLPPWHREIVFDPQTSGGLLVAMPEEAATEALRALREAGVEQAQAVGRVLAHDGEARVRFR